MDFILSKIMNRSSGNSRDNLVDNEIITDDHINPTELLNTQNITNVNDQVEIGCAHQKVTTSLTKKVKEENENLKYDDENNVVTKNSNLNVENSSPDELKLQKRNPSPQPLPDIVNVLPVITVNESPTEIGKNDRITSNILHEYGKINIPSGASSSISSDDELFVECETYSKIDKTQQLATSSNWKNVLSSLCSQNVENLENSKIDLDISPQSLNSCLDTINNILENNVEHQKNEIVNLNVDQVVLKNDNDVDNYNSELSLKEIRHQKLIETENCTLDTFANPIFETENRTLDTTYENNVMTELDDSIDKRLVDQIANLQISSLSNSLNSTVVENALYKTMERNVNTTVDELGSTDKIELLDIIEEKGATDSVADNELQTNLNLTEVIEIVELTHGKQMSLDINLPLPNANLVNDAEMKKTILTPKDPEVLENTEIISKNSSILHETPSHKVSELKSNVNLENETKSHNLNLTVNTEEKKVLITSEISQDNLNLPTTSEDNILLNKSEMQPDNLNLSTEVEILPNPLEILQDNLNLTTTICSEDKILPNTSEISEENSIDIENVQILNATRNIEELSQVKHCNLSVTGEENTVKNGLDVIHDDIVQKINVFNKLSSQSDIEPDILSNSDNFIRLNNFNSDTNMKNNNELYEISQSKNVNNDSVDQLKNTDLNLTVDINKSVNDPKITIPKKSLSLETIYETAPIAANLNATQNLQLTIEKNKSINELNITCVVDNGQSSPNLNFVDSGSQGNLNRTFAASIEALNSTIIMPMAKNSNLPIISSPVDSEKRIKLRKNDENLNFEVKEDDFQSNGLILNQRDFDFLLTKGNNNNNIQVGRSSLLLKFDPLLAKPQVTQEYQQDIITEHQSQQQQLHLQQFNQEFSPLISVTSSSHGRRLSPAVEEEEYFDIVPKSSSLFDINQENLIIPATGTSLSSNTKVGAIKTEPLEFSNNTMSIDVVRDMKTENNFISSENDINSTDVKYDIKMEDLEKKIQNEVLKRTEEIGKKLKEVEQREEALLRRITEKDKTTAKMGSVIEAYEKAIAEMIAEKEEITHNYERQLAEIKSERDLNYQHLASLESTFADLHVKYERSKQITAKLKANEEESCAARKQFLENLRLQEQRYEKMKSHALQQLEIANNKLEFLTKNHSSEITKLKALLKKEEISKGSIAEQLQQKTRENEELVKICDELINGQGS